MFNIFANTNPTDNQFNEILKNYILPISLVVAGVIFITVLILFIIAMVKNKKEKNVAKRELPSDDIVYSLGGKDNIINASLNGSRLSLVLKDYKLVNESKLNELGIDSIIKMSNKIILVSKDDLKQFYNNIINRWSSGI